MINKEIYYTESARNIEVYCLTTLRGSVGDMDVSEEHTTPTVSLKMYSNAFLCRLTQHSKQCFMQPTNLVAVFKLVFPRV